MSRIGLKKIEFRKTSSGNSFGISDVFRRASTVTFLKNPFESVYLQLSQAQFLDRNDPHQTVLARPQDLDDASVSVLLRSRIIKEQINTLSKMTQEAERRIEAPKHTFKQNRNATYASNPDFIQSFCSHLFFFSLSVNVSLCIPLI